MSGLGARVAESFGSLARVFRNPGLRRLELAFLGSTMGHWTYVVGLSVYAYDKGGTTAVGIISVLRLLPAAIASPFLATLADRYRRERVMMATDLIRAALMALAAVVIATDGPALVVYAVVILTNLVGVAFRPAQAALLPGLARDPAELSAANVAASTLDAVSTFAGPAIGGIILALWNVEAVFGLNALWFLSSAVLLSASGRPRRPPSPLDAVRQPPRLRLRARAKGMQRRRQRPQRLDGDRRSTPRRRSSPARSTCSSCSSRSSWSTPGNAGVGYLERGARDRRLRRRVRGARARDARPAGGRLRDRRRAVRRAVRR